MELKRLRNLTLEIFKTLDHLNPEFIQILHRDPFV